MNFEKNFPFFFQNFIRNFFRIFFSNFFFQNFFRNFFPNFFLNFFLNFFFWIFFRIFSYFSSLSQLHPSTLGLQSVVLAVVGFTEIIWFSFESKKLKIPGWFFGTGWFNSYSTVWDSLPPFDALHKYFPTFSDFIFFKRI